MSSGRRNVYAVVHFPEFGGPHNQLLRLAAPLEPHGWKLTALLPDGPGAQRLAQGGVSVRLFPLGRFRALKQFWAQLRIAGSVPRDIWRLWRSFRAERPDVVQLSSLMNPHAAYAAKVLGIPVVWQIVDTRPPMIARRIMMFQIRHLADVVMPIGEAVARAHPGTSSFEERCISFYPPVDAGLFSPRLSDIREELGIDEGRLVVATIGNINPQKGHEYLIEAAAQLQGNEQHPVIIFVGHIYENHLDYYQSLLDRANRLGLEIGRDIYFTGARTDVANVLNGVDIFAMASVPNSEGMPTVILEAMACAKPVISTDVASTSEVVRDGVTGWVVPPEDPEAIALAIAKLMADEELRTRMGTEGRKRVEDHYTMDHYVEAHLRAYELACARHSGRRKERGRK